MDDEKNFLKLVVLNSDVYSVCLQHALTTEKEEIMGLLIGQIDEKKKISHILAAVILHRSDKQPDRVEIPPELIFTAATYAEEISQKINKPMRVIGWYHSHPHITVWPSHVDVRTQALYQTMDPLFIGLIFSVYSNDVGSTVNHIQVTCFQAMKSGSEYNRKEIELVFGPSPLQLYNLEAIIKLPKILFEEEVKSHGEETKSEIVNDLTTLHNDAIRTIELVHIISKVSQPLSSDLEERLVITRNRIKELQKLKKRLQNERQNEKL